MASQLDLRTLVHILGPRFSEAAADRDTEARFAAQNYEELRKRKIFSAMVPADLGGGGVPHSEMCAFLRALAQYCGSTALSLSMHSHLVAAAVFNYRNGRPGQKLLEKVATNEAILVSTGANDWLASNGNAVRTDGGFRVTAKKPFASGSPKGDIIVTSAPYQDPQQGWQVLHFPVPMRAEGVSLAGDWDTFGMRATGSETVILDDVFVPEEAVVLRRPRAAYHPVWDVIIPVALPLIMSVYTGVAEAAAEIATRQARKRMDETVGPVLLGEMTNHLTTAQLAIDDMVHLADDWQFTPSPELSSAVLARKTIVAKATTATAEKALEVCGGGGFHRKLGLERLLRDVHAAQFHPLAEKRQQMFTGRLALGLDPIGAPAEPVLKAAAE